MPRKNRNMRRRPRVADEIMAGMRELQRMMDKNQDPQELFTIRTIEIPDPGDYRAGEIRQLRHSLRVSQAVFASLLGVSLVLVKSWEQGTREPSALARRLLDTIKADPAGWLATLRQTVAA